MAWIRKWGTIVGALCWGLVFFGPGNGYAVNKRSLSYDIFSWGPLSVEFDLLPINSFFGLLAPIGAPLAEMVFQAYFPGPDKTSETGCSRNTDRSIHSVPPAGMCNRVSADSSLPKISRLRVTIDAESHYAGRPLQIKFHEVFHCGRLAISGGAYLEVMDDGKMIFRHSPFQGHVVLHYDRKLSVFDADDELVCVVFVDRGRLRVLLEQSERGELARGILLGSRG